MKDHKQLRESIHSAKSELMKVADRMLSKRPLALKTGSSKEATIDYATMAFRPSNPHLETEPAASDLTYRIGASNLVQNQCMVEQKGQERILADIDRLQDIEREIEEQSKVAKKKRLRTIEKQKKDRMDPKMLGYYAKLKLPEAEESRSSLRTSKLLPDYLQDRFNAAHF